MSLRRLQMLLITGLFFCEIHTAWSQPPGEESTPVVHINNEVLTVKELQDMTRQLPLFLRATLETERGKRKAVDWIIDWKLMLADALQKGVDKAPEVRAQIAAAQEKIILSAYVSRLVKERIVVSEAELEEEYTRNQEGFKLSEAIRVSHILVKSEEEAHEILEELQKGADFSRLAQERSLDPSRRHGGQMGWLESKVTRNAIAWPR